MRKAGWIGWAAVVVAGGMALTACNKKEAPAGAQGNGTPGANAAASKGVGPIQSVTVGPIDEALVAKGQQLFSGTCSACHKLDQRYVGPALAGVTKRRTPEWIMNMVLNPTGMTQQDPTAKDLLGQYLTQMSVNVKEEDARAVLEFFRKNDGT